MVPENSGEKSWSVLFKEGMVPPASLSQVTDRKDTLLLLPCLDEQNLMLCKQTNPQIDLSLNTSLLYTCISKLLKKKKSCFYADIKYVEVYVVLF